MEFQKNIQQAYLKLAKEFPPVKLDNIVDLVVGPEHLRTSLCHSFLARPPHCVNRIGMKRMLVQNDSDESLLRTVACLGNCTVHTR